MFRRVRKRKGDIAVIASLVILFIIGVTQTNDDRHQETSVHEVKTSSNIGRKQLQADVDVSSSNQISTLHRHGLESDKHPQQTYSDGDSNEKLAVPRPPLLVYVYDVPLMFTTELLHCASNNTDNGQQRLEKLNTTGGEDYLEVQLHRALLNSRYVTNDASKADVLFIPFYASLACNCRYSSPVNITDLHFQLWQYMDQALPYFRNGKPTRPHFMALSRAERYHWTKNCPLLRDKEHTGEIIFIGTEKENNNELRKYAGRGTSQMIVAPYPAQEPIAADDRKRNIYTFFHDTTFPGHGVRSVLRQQITNIHISSTADEPIETDTMAVRFIDNLNQRMTSQIAYKWMKRSVFCLQAPADTQIQASLYDAIAAGCIPVTFLQRRKKHKVEFPFEDKLDYFSFTINIPPEAVLSGEQNTTWYLRTLPKLRIAIMQNKLRKYSRQLLYSNKEGKNAFEMIIEEMIQISS